jgi:hypothetical protein
LLAVLYGLNPTGFVTFRNLFLISVSVTSRLEERCKQLLIYFYDADFTRSHEFARGRKFYSKIAEL